MIDWGNVHFHGGLGAEPIAPASLKELADWHGHEGRHSEPIRRRRRDTSGQYQLRR